MSFLSNLLDPPALVAKNRAPKRAAGPARPTPRALTAATVGAPLAAGLALLVLLGVAMGSRGGHTWGTGENAVVVAAPLACAAVLSLAWLAHAVSRTARVTAHFAVAAAVVVWAYVLSAGALVGYVVWLNRGG